MPIELTVVAPGDAEALAALKAATFVETFGDQNDPVHLQAHVARAFTTEAIRDTLLEDGATTWWLVDDGAPVGYVKVNRGDSQTEPGLADGLEVEQVYVLASHHGRGHGRRLLAHAIDTARAEGYPSIWLGVWEHNRRAIEVYEHLGFVPFGDHTFLFGTEEQRDVLDAPRALSAAATALSRGWRRSPSGTRGTPARGRRACRRSRPWP